MKREMEVSIGNRSRTSRTMFMVLVFLSTTLCLPHVSVSVSAHQCKAWLVQSIPTDMPHLSRVSGVLSTGDVFHWLAQNSSHKLGIIAQYWQLNAQLEDPHSGDYGYSKADMSRFGAAQGSQVYKAIDFRGRGMTP